MHWQQHASGKGRAQASGTIHPNKTRRGPVAFVVDDDNDQRELIGTILEESEVKVIDCDSGEAAMKMMKTPWATGRSFS